MTAETVKMSSKGQIVIPQEIREELHIGEGSLFAVVRYKDTIILKKIPRPSPEDLVNVLDQMARRGKKMLQKRGFTEADLRSK